MNSRQSRMQSLQMLAARPTTTARVALLRCRQNVQRSWHLPRARRSPETPATRLTARSALSRQASQMKTLARQRASTLHSVAYRTRCIRRPAWRCECSRPAATNRP
jgi:hypothetical protein